MRISGILLHPLCLLPLVAGAQIGRPGGGQQIRLGERVATEIRHEEKILPDTDPRVIEVRRVASKLLSTLHDKEPWHFSFDVIELPDVNAFSLPGGPTFVFTGLLNKLKTEDELAGILGHELTHVRKQHWAAQYWDSQRRDIVLNLGLLLGRVNDTIGNLVGVTNQLGFELPYSRSEEKQADEGGFHMMVDAGYNPVGMANVFRTFMVTERGEQPPPFLSDHPSDASRIKHIEELISQIKIPFPPQRPLQ